MQGYSKPEGYGKTVRMRLVSNRLCYGPAPRSDEEVEQRLTILENGQVYLSRYSFGDGKSDHHLETERIHVSHEKIADILHHLDRHFFDRGISSCGDDVGTWDVVLTDENGRKARFEGALIGDEEMDGQTDLSTRIRLALHRPNLFLFDRSEPDDSIMALKIDYLRTTRRGAEDIELYPFLPAILEYREQISIRLKEGRIILVKDKGHPRENTLRIPLRGSATELYLEKMEGPLSYGLPREPEDDIVEANIRQTFQVTIDF